MSKLSKDIRTMHGDWCANALEAAERRAEEAEAQIERLAQFILDEVPGEPSQSQGAVDTAIRLIRETASRPSTTCGAKRYRRAEPGRAVAEWLVCTRHMPDGRHRSDDGSAWTDDSPEAIPAPSTTEEET